MNKYFIKLSRLATAAALLVPASMTAQNENEGKTKNKEVQQIIITTRGEQKEKIVVEIDDDKVTVNGKPLEEYLVKDGEINVKLNRIKDLESITYFWRPPLLGTGRNFNKRLSLNNEDENRAMLGVGIEKAVEGVRIFEIKKGSAAEKAGLKEDDIITKINDTKIVSPDELTEVIKNHKPGDKVTITFLRGKKEQKVSAELTKWKGIDSLALSGEIFNFDKTDPPLPPDFKVPDILRKLYMPTNTPRLGISVQDTDDGKGVKVIKVQSESNAAKAGIKEEDIITHLDDVMVNNVDEVTKLMKEKKDNPTVRFQLSRKDKTQIIEVKMPRELKTAEF